VELLVDLRRDTGRRSGLGLAAIHGGGKQEQRDGAESIGEYHQSMGGERGNPTAGAGERQRAVDAWHLDDAPSTARSAAAALHAAPSTPAATIYRIESDTGPTYGRGVPHPGNWTPTTVYEDSLFTIEYPASAKVQREPADTTRSRWYPQLVIEPLPECRWTCRLTIVVRRTSNPDLLRRLIAEVKRPKTRDEEEMAEGPKSVIDTLPFGADPAVHFSDYCGDCGQFEFMTTHGPWVATIEYSLDDREDYNPALLAKIDAVTDLPLALT
jgi:hypothetical protein